MSGALPDSQALRDEATFFVVGTTRSGTSLLSLMLKNHPAIAYPGEFEWAVDFMPGPDSYPPVDAYVDWLSINRHYRHHRPHIDATLSYPDLVRSFLAQMKQEQAPHKPLVGMSVHRHFDRLLHLFPGARFVHIVRDPRDVARSWIEFGWEGNGWAAGRAWADVESLWDRIRPRIPGDRVHEVRFEDLVRDPPAELARLCSFFGIPYTDAMLRYPETSTYGPVDPNQVGKWRKTLPLREQRRVDGEIGAALLASRGYEPCGAPPLHAGPFAARLLALDDWWRRLRKRIAMFGFGIWFCDQIAKALRLEGWHRRLELRRQAIINASLK
ncbi:MAG: sulfotransferase [Myxococcota bacterium]|nr:sulfotransferase [Myxococcota bacterium]